MIFFIVLIWFIILLLHDALCDLSETCFGSAIINCITDLYLTVACNVCLCLFLFIFLRYPSHHEHSVMRGKGEKKMKTNK